jgi:GTP-binding protein LepA
MPKTPCTNMIHGFEDVKPMVFAGIYPIDTEDYEDLRASMEKLQLNDASLVFNQKVRWHLDLVSVVVS